MSQSSDERAAELRELFFESAQELLQALNEQALEFEKHPEDVENIRSIRRTVHTLKGDAAACGYRELGELAHQFEDALAEDVVSGHAPLAEVAFAAADVFTSMLEAYRGNKKLPKTEALRKPADWTARRDKMRAWDFPCAPFDFAWPRSLRRWL